MTHANIASFRSLSACLAAVKPGDTLASSDGGDRYTGLDRFGRVIDQWWYDPSTSTTLDRFQYGYDRDGNVLYKNNRLEIFMSELYHAQSTSSGDDNTAYDGLSRITTFLRGPLAASGHNGLTLDSVGQVLQNLSWQLDALGNANSVSTNGTPQNRTFNSQNEAITVGSSTLTYDSNGNTTTDDQGHTLVYDAWNHLVAVKNGGTTIASYGYDALGDRTTETENSTTTALYYSSSMQVLEERQGGTITVQNVWGIGYVNQIVLRDDDSISGNLGKTGSGLGERIYVLQDANYNTTALANTSGAVLQRFVYTPYGVMTVLNSGWSTTTDIYNWRTTFQGMRYDPVTGLLHADARDYSPTLERWIEADPAHYIDGLDLYQPELSNPIDQIDPSGLATSSGPTSGPTTSPSVGFGLPNKAPPTGFSEQNIPLTFPSGGTGTLIMREVRNDAVDGGVSMTVFFKPGSKVPCACDANNPMHWSQKMMETINNPAGADLSAAISAEIYEHGGVDPTKGWVLDNGKRPPKSASEYELMRERGIADGVPAEFAPPPPLRDINTPPAPPYVAFEDGPWLPQTWPKGVTVSKHFILTLYCGNKPLGVAIGYTVTGTAGGGYKATRLNGTIMIG